jgi:hypothetical protein
VPLQNRVTPTGEIVVDAGRGLLTGNRGCLHGHNHDRTLGVSRWRSKLWISCVLDWRGIRRDPMPPGRWTMLFFLDEATALAAGHRPCGYCRRTAYASYVDAWRWVTGSRPHAVEMDAVLHAERVDRRTRRQVTRPARAGDLPDGVMVRPGSGSDVGLVRAGRFRPWTFTGYGPPVPLEAGTRVELLTPPASVAVLRAGYEPLLHPSVDDGSVVTR